MGIDMKTRVLLLIIVVLHASLIAGAKNCPSTLQTNLHTFDNLSLGGEFRFWYYYVNQYDYQAQRSFDETYNFGSVRGMAEYELSDTLFAGIEAVVRRKVFSDDTFQCNFASEDTQFNLRQLWLDYESDAFILHAGRDVLASGNQMVLDNFVDQVTVEFDVNDVSISAGAGVLANDVSREALSCQREIVYEHHQCWKDFCIADWGDQRLGFVESSFSLFPKQYQRALLLYTDSVFDEQDSVIADLYLHGALGFGIKYFTELALQKYHNESTLYGAASFIFSKRFSFLATTQHVQSGLLVAQRDNDRRFAPLYESLWIGERYRYSLYQGDIFYLKHTMTFEALEPLSLVTQYSQQFSGDTSDELDIGLNIALTDTYRVFITYSALNFIGDYEMTHQLQLHTRLIF